MYPLLLLSIVLLNGFNCARASPIPEAPPEGFPIFYVFIIFVTPVTLLVIGKYSYCSYRRVRNLHAFRLGSAVEPKNLVSSESSSRPKTETTFTLDITLTHPLIVGFFGSPDWESGCSVRDQSRHRVRRVSQQMANVEITKEGQPTNSRVSICQSTQQPVLLPRSPVSIMEVISPAIDIQNCSVVHPLSPPCNDTSIPPNPAATHGDLTSEPFYPIQQFSCSSCVRASQLHHLTWGGLPGDILRVHLKGLLISVCGLPHVPKKSSPNINIGRLAAAKAMRSACKMESRKVQSGGTELLSPDSALTPPQRLSQSSWMSTPRPSSKDAFGLDLPVVETVAPSVVSNLGALGSLSSESRATASSTIDESAGSSSGVLSELENSVLKTKSWELDDLLKDGKLDIDAVNDILGLGGNDRPVESPVGLSDDGYGWKRERDNDSTSIHIRSPGQPLCAIPEETEDIMESIGKNQTARSSWSARTNSDKFCSGARSSACLEIDLSVLGSVEEGEDWGGRVVVDSASITGEYTVLIVASRG